ncbi:3-oxoacyl-ACP synthase III family protein [Caldithrix abyssi]|uniref:Beta-ketoacyl-[acyl-carrier-protein] synthase III n=1 Tax=Caldithrix abyssi DSM 13497 TaxID=880073 RepID=H1XRJ0_CALAY|nr:beta-ketoacyl-ACP synthase III [Caldithrix abyssi]APF20068.1 fabH 3-oxoacyl-(acyl-carrier-protein) synthase-3 [Caldithrix abyssi DSM 13497]EHO40143.1 3-oxoacyl-(acyl-carrier-protein) synthase 3 [Caldithrix abyssi DSM 13497]
MRKSIITGVGRYLPENVVTNSDLEKIMDTSDQWIRERTGIVERRFADLENGETTSYMGAQAAKKALEMAGLKATDIDFIIFATLSPDYFFPGAGCPLQVHLDIPGIGAMDIRNQCTGFVYALATADQFIKSGMYNHILVVGAEVHSSGLNLSTEGRDVAVLFGDGAGAVVVSAYEGNDGRGILTSHLHADGRFAKQLWVEAPGASFRPHITEEMLKNGKVYPYMNGRYVFKHAVTRFPEVIMEALKTAQVNIEDVDLVIPHQANQRITEAVQMRLGLPKEKVFSNIHKYGNTTAASIPIAMSEALEQGLIKEGNLICLAAFGSGFTWASSLIRW